MNVPPIRRPPVGGQAAPKEPASKPFYINKATKLRIDPITQKHIRNSADERAASMGMRFSTKRADHVCNWVTSYCTLYEGDKAGTLMVLADWQELFFSQVFGWVRFSEDWGRWIRRYREADVWIAKKNGKSPTLAACGLYVLTADGEMGQKCYSVAKDGGQAMIAHRHAMQMVKYSDALQAECKVHESTGTITHLPTTSFYQIVTGDDSRTRRAKEGLNGSLFVDEVHVVDGAMMSIIRRAGISRSEPLSVGMSTSGDNLDGYGYARYQLGLSIEDGRRFDPEFFFLDYSIDQKTEVSDLYDEAKVEKLAIQANPTLGRIVRKSELMGDWHKSVGTLKTLLEFAMYRLNLWLRSGDAWIPLPDWLACGRSDFTFDDLMEFPCVAGLDLSKSLDMSSLTYVFAVPETDNMVRPYIWNKFWLPEAAAQLYQDNINFYEWSDHINIIPGKTIQYDLIANELEWAKSNLDLRRLGYDPYNSDSLMILLENDYGWDEELLVNIPQRMQYMGPAAGDFEKLILSQNIRHGYNPVMDWQFGHCRVKEDDRGNKMPIKPTRNDYRKVDGIVSTVMGIAMYVNEPDMYGDKYDSILLYDTNQLREYAEKLESENHGELSPF